MSRVYNEMKLAELILYIADKCAYDAHFGATKLNKILFYADFLAYARWGEPVTGAEYVKLEHGPAPKRMMPLKEALTKRGDVVEREIPFHGRTQKRLLALRPADLEALSARDVAVVDEVIEALGELSAREVSELSHGTLAWQLAMHGEVIPYPAVLLSGEPTELTEEEHAYGLELLEAIRHREHATPTSAE